MSRSQGSARGTADTIAGDLNPKVQDQQPRPPRLRDSVGIGKSVPRYRNRMCLEGQTTSGDERFPRLD
jgi:hypothetical protein